MSRTHGRTTGGTALKIAGAGALAALVVAAVGRGAVALRHALRRGVDRAARSLPAEERLRRREAQYQRLFDLAADGAAVLRDGRLAAANPAAARILGYASPDEMVGRTIMEFVHPESRPRTAARLARLDAGEPTPLEPVTLLRADGRAVLVDVASTPLSAEPHAPIYTTLRDATARVRAEEELRESEERYRLAARATHDVVWDWNPADDALVVGDALGATFGHRIPGGRTTRSWWWALIHPDDVARVRESAASALAGREEEWRAEYRLRRPDGSYAVVVDRGYVVRDAAGRATRVVGAAADVSPRRNLEEQLRHSQRLETLGRLTGGVAHDFNNVLTAIAMHGEMLLEALPPDDPVREDAEEIRRAAERATSLTRQLLIFGRRQAARPEMLDLNDVVAGVRRMLERLIGSEIELVTRAEAGLPAVRADRGQIEQVLLNLTINARDAIAVGGVIVIETARAVLDDEYVRLHPGASPGAHVMLAVTDTGSGMDAATRARIFEPFFTTKPEGRGTGLGLSVVQGIVRESGGHVFLHTEPGRGTTFKVFFPAAAAEPAPPPERLASAARGAPVARETILLVEEDDAMRTAARRRLERDGYTVVEARSGGEALQLASRGAGPLDLVVTDLTVAGEPGPALVKRVAAVRPGIRALYMSGYGEAAVEHLGLARGVPYIEKPFTSDALERKVREALG